MGFVAVLLVGCIRNDLDGINPSDMEVRLWGGVDGATTERMGVQSRGTATSTSGILTPTSECELNIGIARISKIEDADVFPDFRSLGDPLVATLGLPDPENSYYRPIEFKHLAQFFPDAKNELRYVGWSPWNESDISTPNVDDDGSEYYSDHLKTEVTVAITGDKDVLYGDMIEGTLSSGFPVMEFNHALCLYRIYAYAMVGEIDIENNPTATIDHWGKLEEVSLQRLPKEVTMTLPHQCTEEPPVHKSGDVFTLSFAGEQDIPLHNTDNNIFFDAPEKLPIGIADAVLVSKCVAGPPASGIMTISLKTSEQTAEQEVSIARNFQPGHAYDIYLRFSDHGIINAEVSVGEWQVHEGVKEEVAANMYFDLSRYETANSYIISSANYYYCFDGTVKGNGDGSLLGMSAEEVSVGDVGWVDIIWQDIPTFDHDGDSSTPEVELITIEYHQLSDNKVLFGVQGFVDGENIDNKALPVEGNALIGAYTANPEEGGELLWAWHIWATDKPRGVGCANGYVIYDRNLGATSPEPAEGSAEFDPSHGLYYQWGRPTPLKKEDLTVSSQLLTLDNLFPDSNTNTIYGSGSSGSVWLDPASSGAENLPHLWGDTGYDYERHKKTLYDPCPPGYFVANHKFWQGVEKYEHTYDADRGVELKFLNNLVWLPRADILDDQGATSSDFIGIRTATIDYSKSPEVPYYLAYESSKTATVTSDNSHYNYAAAVRCISLATDPVIKDLSESQTANCYMVTAPGYYKFNASIRGNGVSHMWPYGGTSMLYINDGMSVDINPAKVDLLWWQGDFTEVTNTAEDLQNLMRIEILNDGKVDEDGYVTFYIDQLHAGNAILAAYDEDGVILWTWHIWMILDRPEDVNSGKRTLQDRFLGATQAPVIGNGTLSFLDYNGNESTSDEALWATFGFYYQWGRKDPIVGAPVGASADENPANAAETLASSPYWLKDYTTGEWSLQTTIPRHVKVAISESVKEPMNFYMSTTSGGYASSQWFSEDFADSKRNVALWGYAVDDYSAQGQDFSKTMYDPCPPGYRTAFHQVWKITVNGTIYAYGGDDGGVSGNTNAGATVYWSEGENDYSDYGFVTTQSYFDKTFYPYAGLRLSNTGGYSGVLSYGHLATGMPMGQYNTRSFVYSNSGWSRQNQSTATTTANAPTGQSHGSAYAKSIRCMKE